MTHVAAGTVREPVPGTAAGFLPWASAAWRGPCGWLTV